MNDPFLVASLVLAFALPQQKHDELFYQRQIIERYGMEEGQQTPSGARCDLMTEDYAIEVDWAYKYAEGIGQAALYAAELKRKPLVILLLKADHNPVHLERALKAARYVNFPVWLYDCQRGELTQAGKVGQATWTLINKSDD